MFLKDWISLFASMKNVFSDNTREFASSELLDFIDVCANFNANILANGIMSFLQKPV